MKHGYAKGVFIKVIILLKKHIRLQSFVGAASHHRHRTALVGGFLADSACMIRNRSDLLFGAQKEKWEKTRKSPWSLPLLYQ